ncbi:MAG TPA: DUF4129 domain-containing protein [Pyrinomonadaceae bacterium]|nr:DUF4129 domain-containing protein [Pyrinomonadaceae bacterium]
MAVPVSKYRETLEHVIGDFQSLLDKDEEETDADYDERLKANIDAIRTELPAKQPVEFDGETWNADNSWLHTALDELPQTPPEDRNGKITSIVETLRAIDKRVKDLETAKTVSFDKAAANDRLKGILARPEYATSPKGENAVSRLLQDFIRWLQNLFPKRKQGGSRSAEVISSVLQIVVIVVALLLIAYVLWLLLIRFRRPVRARIRKKKQEPRIVLGEKLDPEETSSDLLSEAEALARSGDLRGAIRKGYIALLVELGDRKLISLAQYKTNRDYLRSVSSHPQLHSRMTGLTDSFERHWYGFAQVNQTDWQDFRTGYREALQSGN